MLSSFGHALYLAARNLRRQLRRSLSALLTISSGVLALLLAEGYSAGMFSEFRESTIRADYGHLQLTRPGFHELGRSDLDAFRVELDPQVLQKDLPPGSAVAPRFLFSGLASSGEVTLPFTARGIDPAVDAQGGNALQLVAGRRLAADEREGVLLGQGLAARLGLGAGETIMLLVTTAEGQLNAREAPVIGVVASSTEAVDDVLLLAPISLGHALMRSSGSHQLLVFLPPESSVARSMEALEPIAEGQALELRDWLSLAEFYRRAEALFRQQLTVVIVIVAAILLLSIGNTMMMTVMERTREIGTVMALGTRPGRVLRGFLLEGALLGLAGVLLGIILAYLCAAIMASLQLQMPPPPGFTIGYTASILIEPETLARVAFLTWAATVMASYYPALRASRLCIVDALRVVR